MNFFLPNNITRVLTMAVLCIAYAALQAFAFRWMVSFSYLTLFLIASAEAVFFLLLSVFLYKAIRFGNYVVLELHQRFINYLALGLLSVGVWGGASLLASYVVAGKENMGETWQMMPMKVFIGIWVYILVVQLIHNRIENENNVPEEDEEVMPIAIESAEAVEILDRVVSDERDVNPEAIEVLVHRLRKRLAGSQVRIGTLRGLGYVLEHGA